MGVLTREQCIEMIELRAEGQQTKEITKAFYVDRTTFYQCLREYGLHTSYLKAYDKHLKRKCTKAIELRKEGFGVDEIMQELGLRSQPGFYKMLRRMKKYKRFVAARESENYRVYKKAKNGHTERLNFSWVYNQRAVFGRSHDEIAEEIGCCRSKVTKFCVKYNIPKADKQTAQANRSNVNEALEKAW